MTEQEESNVPSVLQRKLVASGASVVITIPPEWLNRKNLGAGDTVTMVLADEVSIFKNNSETLGKVKKKL